MKAAVLWTGGKDSALALYEARLSGYAIRNLVTFIPDGADFLAHPISFMKMQAQALEIPHYIVNISEPFQENYEKAIFSIKEGLGVDTLVTGDIAQVDGYPNWIRECSLPSGMRVLTPLWGQDRLGLLNRLLSRGFRVVFSGVKKPWFTEEWLGREINNHSIEQLCALGSETGLDLCGEQGEYHTLVLDGPPFKKSLEITAYERNLKDSIMVIEIRELGLRDK
ncbi:MAG: diphthine--ammonia ligase [Deltaproteobacteria bacterium]|nr:diphthine--ammonia ligase [Deltaproteobacteria bacterium]